MENSKRDANFYFLKGEEEKSHDLKKAIKYYEKALEIDPQQEDVLFAHGQEVYRHVAGMFWGRGRIVQFIRSIGKFPINAIDFYKRGVGWEIWCLPLHNSCDQAISDYTVAIRMNPRYACAYHRRGTVYKKQGMYDQAIADYTKAIELRPRHVKYYVDRARAYYCMGEHDKAIFEFNKAIEIDPSYGLAYYDRGKVYSDKRYYVSAVSDFSKAVELYSKKYIVYYLKADYVKIWDDVHKAKEVGYQADTRFLKTLYEASEPRS
jgi:tetratricopeptide (TPR) repeat protein